MSITDSLKQERDQLFVTTAPQARSLKPGVTREQAKRFYTRETAVIAARVTRIQTGYGVDTVLMAIDRVIADGCTEVRTRGRWVSLWNTETGIGYQYGDKVSRDYIDVVFNQGNMARNY